MTKEGLTNRILGCPSIQPKIFDRKKKNLKVKINNTKYDFEFQCHGCSGCSGLGMKIKINPMGCSFNGSE